MLSRASPDPAFWSGKRVLLTGHTGFKGAWLSLWLSRMGALVTGISLPPATEPSLFRLARVDELLDSHYGDIRDAEALTRLVQQSEAQIVLHLAAQPLVRESYSDPVGTFDTNVMGTANLLESLRSASALRVVVVATTDKVYRNLEHGLPYREDDPLGGYDPYSASKAACEMVIASYRDSFFKTTGVALSSARAGNVIGGGDWAKERLIPDAVRAWQNSEVLQIRRPQSTRPWQHVLEPLAGYLVLAHRTWQSPDLAGAYNFGPLTHEAATVREIVQCARHGYGRGEVEWGDGSEGPHEAGWLSLEIAKSRSVLQFEPRWGLQSSIERTMAWYRQLQAGEDARGLCASDINAFEGSQ